MPLPIFDKCCCCMSLRNGLITFGSLNAALSTFVLILLNFASVMKVVRHGNFNAPNISPDEQNNTDNQEEDTQYSNYEIYAITTAYFGLRLILAVILIVGAKKGDAKFLKIYNIFQLVQMTFTGIWMLVKMFTQPFSMTCIRLIDLGFQGYIFLIIRSLIMEVQAIQPQKDEENNLNTVKNTEDNKETCTENQSTQNS